MAEFEYQGVDRSGKKVTGKLEAPSEGELRMVLRGQGVRPVRISTVSIVNQDLGALIKGAASGGALSTQVLVPFTRQLYVLISSGIPLVQALELLADQAPERNLKSIISSVKEKVSQGSYLWESFMSYPKAFPKIFIALIRAGETSGALEIMLKRLTRYLEDADRLKKMIKGAMMYPVIVLGIGVTVVGVMLAFVIPKFQDLLTSSGQELPGPTQFVINLSDFVSSNILYLTGGIVLTAYLTLRYIQTEEGRGVLHRLLYPIPLFGTLMQKAGVARFSRTMGTLLSSGVNLIDAIDVCKATIDNVVLEEAVAKIKRDIEGGKTLGQVVNKLSVFPRMAVQMIMVGESTGNLDKMLERVADVYEAEVEIMVGSMTKLIEPLILLILGGIVGGLMIAMYLPIFKLAGGAG